MPARKAHVSFQDKRSEIRDTKFVDGEREAKVSLREGGDRTPKGGGHFRGERRIGPDSNKGAILKVDVKTSGRGEVIKQGFKVGDMMRDNFNNN
jgi:hypothetical protein